MTVQVAGERRIVRSIFTESLTPLDWIKHVVPDHLRFELPAIHRTIPESPNLKWFINVIHKKKAHELDPSHECSPPGRVSAQHLKIPWCWDSLCFNDSFWDVGMVEWITKVIILSARWFVQLEVCLFLGAVTHASVLSTCMTPIIGWLAPSFPPPLTSSWVRLVYQWILMLHAYLSAHPV